MSTLSYYYHIYPADVRQRKVVAGVLLVTVLGLISVTATAALEGGLTLRAIQGSVNGMEMLVSISLMHQVYADKHREPMYRTTVFRLAGCFAVLAAGTAIWGLGFPEAFAPRTFDIFGASHQIFHISVISALVLYQYTVVKFWEHLAREAYDYSMGARAHPSSGGTTNLRPSATLSPLPDPVSWQVQSSPPMAGPGRPHPLSLSSITNVLSCRKAIGM